MDTICKTKAVSNEIRRTILHEKLKTKNYFITFDGQLKTERWTYRIDRQIKRQANRWTDGMDKLVEIQAEQRTDKMDGKIERWVKERRTDRMDPMGRQMGKQRLKIEWMARQRDIQTECWAD